MESINDFEPGGDYTACAEIPGDFEITPVSGYGISTPLYRTTILAVSHKYQFILRDMDLLPTINLPDEIFSAVLFVVDVVPAVISRRIKGEILTFNLTDDTSAGAVLINPRLSIDHIYYAYYDDVENNLRTIGICDGELCKTSA